MSQLTPLQTYRHNRRLGYSPQASAVTTIMEHADTAMESRDRVNRVRSVAKPSRKTFNPRSYGHG